MSSFPQMLIVFPIHISYSRIVTVWRDRCFKEHSILYLILHVHVLDLVYLIINSIQTFRLDLWPIPILCNVLSVRMVWYIEKRNLLMFSLSKSIFIDYFPQIYSYSNIKCIYHINLKFYLFSAYRSMIIQEYLFLKLGLKRCHLKMLLMPVIKYDLFSSN